MSGIAARPVSYTHLDVYKRQLQDGVDYHWWDLAKAAGLSTLLSVGAELAVDNDDQLVQAIRNGGQDTINDAGQQLSLIHI